MLTEIVAKLLSDGVDLGAKFPQVWSCMLTNVVAKLPAGVTKQVDLFGSQVAAWDLGEDVAVKKAGKDEASWLTW